MVSLIGAIILSTAFAAFADELSQQQRIQQADDIRQINNLLVDYGLFLDTKDFKSYSELFAREGTWSGGTTNFIPVKGPAAIRTTMEKAFADRVYDPEHITNVHLVSNIRIEIDGDRATGYSKYTVLTRNEQEQSYIRVHGHYDDVYIREGKQWKFLSRVANRDIP
jgi:3-phenylpropionate/cinnamic acid dioxygenase small subunit